MMGRTIKKGENMILKTHSKIMCLGRWLTAGIVLVASVGTTPLELVQAEECPDLRVVFARGSGEEQWSDKNYLEFKSTIEEKLKTVGLKYEFIDLDYPAIGVGVDNLDVMLGAFVSGGEAYDFGASVNAGVENLTAMVNGTSCKNTKYVIGGYSQGAMMLSKALGSLNAERVIYAATFGDPKIYLPEGFGIMPPACQNMNLSDYRMYVPDCQAYKGLLGAYIPYEPDGFIGKLGTWCNKWDVFCSSRFSITDHVSYVSDGLYEDASRVIFNKVTDYFGLENHVTSPHDTAFLIDSTGSMSGLIDQYKAEALRLASETLNAGGRVALYDYRDLNDPYEPVAHCDFESCTLEVFQEELRKIVVDGGGDEPESLLSGSLKVMKSLNWKFGSTKSLVVLTDAGFLSPDRDGVTLDDVVWLSKKIDPVNFYIITKNRVAAKYTELATLTDGKVVTDFDELSLLTDYIMERYDSLPRVEEQDELLERPTLEIINNEQTSENEITISFKTDGEKTLVILNDIVLGLTNGTEITISELRSGNNTISLVPIRSDLKGEGQTLNITIMEHMDEATDRPVSSDETEVLDMPIQLDDIKTLEAIVPKAPNTGRK